MNGVQNELICAREQKHPVQKETICLSYSHCLMFLLMFIYLLAVQNKEILKK
jgi:hypothetical protein